MENVQAAAPWELFQASQVMAMELAVLRTLNWRINAVTAPQCLDRLLCLIQLGRNAGGRLVDPDMANAARKTAKALVCRALSGTARRPSWPSVQHDLDPILHCIMFCQAIAS